MRETTPATQTSDTLVAAVAALESALATERAALAAERAAHVQARALVEQLTEERDHLRASHDRLRQEMELLRRRIFVAKAERVDSTQLELEFAQKLSALDALSGRLAEPAMSTDVGTGASTDGANKAPDKKKPTGRRDLRQANIPEERIEIADPVFDDLVREGKAERIGFEESYKLAWKRGGHRRLLIARVKYRTLNTSPTIETAPMPDETFPRSLAAPSMLAHIVAEKHLQGLPLYRLEARYGREGAPIDRGTMCRWLEDAGATAGATVIAAARKEALKSAFCLATDATGVAVQPIPTDDRKRQPCRRAHFFVQIADRDHVFFEFTPRETSAVVGEMFKGFGGYVQADAKSVYDILFRPPDTESESAVEDRRLEVGCWAHGRRRLWESAIVLKSEVAREGLFRIKRIYDVERTWRGKPPDEIKRLRNIHSRPLVEAFFVWAAPEYEKVRAIRGPLRSAFGYLIRQKDALMRFLDDGRLRLDNNHSYAVHGIGMAMPRSGLCRVEASRAWNIVGSLILGDVSVGIVRDSGGRRGGRPTAGTVLGQRRMDRRGLGRVLSGPCRRGGRSVSSLLIHGQATVQ